MTLIKFKFWMPKGKHHNEQMKNVQEIQN